LVFLRVETHTGPIGGAQGTAHGLKWAALSVWYHDDDGHAARAVRAHAAQ
jgi:hypothetical protein